MDFRNSQTKQNLKDLFTKFDYKSVAQRGHRYCTNPLSLVTSSILAVTSWHIYEHRGTKPILEKPLSSIASIGFFSCIYTFVASTVVECMPQTMRPVVPILLFGSSAYYIGSTYIGNPIDSANCTKKEFTIEFNKSHQQNKTKD